MINKKKILVVAVLSAAFLSAIILFSVRKADNGATVARVEKPVRGDILVTIEATGTVLPYNRLEIKPQINGRMERVLVQEGQAVRTGQIMGWMSSTERAALIDAARSQGAASVKYWQGVIKEIPIVAPINGTVIVRDIEPGQAVSTATAILVLSDRLIVKADVDETDIGRVKKGQRVIIELDAYPDVKAEGRVDLIEFESKIVNNVTMYQVNIIPDRVPEVFRSGMTADVSIIEKAREDVLILPFDAVISKGETHYAWVLAPASKKPEKREIRIGMADDKNIEILSGITAADRIAVMSNGVSLETKSTTNPFMPRRPTEKKSGRTP
ncbi:MAG: efflux RND transporter periplasmic adaptor subunit [Spirochaetes bacterium]|nr:efflux RND transporter periplasmic adaptor subunit [Spirochaetota bacterium]